MHVAHRDSHDFGGGWRILRFVKGAGVDVQALRFALPAHTAIERFRKRPTGDPNIGIIKCRCLREISAPENAPEEFQCYEKVALNDGTDVCYSEVGHIK